LAHVDSMSHTRTHARTHAHTHTHTHTHTQSIDGNEREGNIHPIQQTNLVWDWEWAWSAGVDGCAVPNVYKRWFLMRNWKMSS